MKRLNEASDKVINKLYAKLSEEPPRNTDPMSRVTGVDNVQAMMKDINSNFLIKNRATEMMGKLTPKITSNTPIEILGSHIYDKCEPHVVPVSLFCTVFNHLDWASFAQIAEEQKKKAEFVGALTELRGQEVAAEQEADHLAGLPEES